MIYLNVSENLIKEFRHNIEFENLKQQSDQSRIDDLFQ